MTSRRTATSRLWTVGTVVAALGALGACSFSEPPNGTVKCGALPRQCPDGYECSSITGTCWQSGKLPDGGARAEFDGSPAVDSLHGEASPTPVDAGFERAGWDGAGAAGETGPVVDVAPALDLGLDKPIGSPSTDVAADLVADLQSDFPFYPTPDLRGIDSPSASCNGDLASCALDAALDCASRSYDDGNGLFVDGVAGSDDDCGARTKPCKTIGRGISRAAGLKTVVYVASGTYVETIDLLPGLRVEGGWSNTAGTWSPVCAAQSAAVIIQAPDTQPAGKLSYAVGAHLPGSTTLALVTVLGKAVAAASESIYGVVATGLDTTLILEGVSVTVKNGGSGADGMPGASGNNAERGGCAVPPSDGGNAASVANGEDAATGMFSSAGYLSGNGKRGPDGEAGHAGRAGTAPGCKQGTACRSSRDGDCSAQTQMCGTEGLPGCPGQGGRGGEPGLGGGSSVALFVWDARVSLVAGSLQSGDGGWGGKGGLGGFPGNGAPGKAGAAGTVTACSSECTAWGSYQECQATACVTATTDSVAAGGEGGVGGNGARGGDGGSGSGGGSFGVYRGGAAAVTSASTTVKVGSPGRSRGSAPDGKAEAGLP